MLTSWPIYRREILNQVIALNTLEYSSLKIILYGNFVLNCASEPQVCAHTLLWAFFNIFKMWKKNWIV
jgi:hypothetical protein